MGSRRLRQLLAREMNCTVRRMQPQSKNVQPEEKQTHRTAEGNAEYAEITTLRLYMNQKRCKPWNLTNEQALLHLGDVTELLIDR